MDGALFSLLFLFFIQIAAGVAPLLFPQHTWIARVVFWVSTIGAVICLAWYGWSNLDWLIAVMGQKTLGVIIAVAAMVLFIFGLILVGSPLRQPAPTQKISTPRNFGRLESEVLLSGPRKSVYRRMEIGDSGSIFQVGGPQGTALFTFFENSQLIIEVVEGSLKVSTTLRDQMGDLVVELQRNEWKVAPPPKTWDRNYTETALEVINPQGRVALQVRLLPDRLQLQGEWWHDQIQGVRIVKSDVPNKPGGLIQIFGTGFRPENGTEIKRLFVYPSEFHLGELLKRGF